MSRPITATLALTKSLPNDAQNTSGLAESWGPVMDANLDTIDAALAGAAATGAVKLAPTADQTITGHKAFSITLWTDEIGSFTFNGPNDLLEMHQVHSQGISVYNHSHSSIINFFSSGGTQASPTAIGNTTVPVEIRFGGYDGSVYGPGAFIVSVANEAWTPTAHGMSLQLKTVARGTMAAKTPLTLINNAVFLSADPAAPVDADLANSNISFYLDEAGNNLKVRVKYSNGTLKTATVPLL
jgi:hypothetical protein